MTATATPAVQTNPVIIDAPTKRGLVNVMPGYSVQPQMVTICSVYPGPRRSVRRHNGITVYAIPPADRNGYVLLNVFDTQEWCQKIDPQDGKRELEPRPIPAMAVADDLMRDWTSYTLVARTGNAPGISIIPAAQPTPEILERLRSRQADWFQAIILDGNDKHIRGDSRNITDLHRWAAKWMLGTGAERLPWYPRIEFADVKQCPGCSKQMVRTATRCENCSLDLPEWYLKYGIDPVTDEMYADPAIAAFMQRMPKKAALEAEAARLRAENQRLKT